MQVQFQAHATPEQIREYTACANDPAYFLAHYGKIKHKRLGTIPFALWDWQIELLDAFLAELLLIVLKARQIGVSELAIGYALWLIRFQATRTALVISKNGPDADDLLERAKFAHTMLPDWLQAGPLSIDGARPGKINMGTLEILHPDPHSRRRWHPSLIQSLAATENAGRSRPASLVISDEWAHQPFDMWGAIAPTIDGGGRFLGISTANGVGNRFHSTWTKAKRGENRFRPVFLPWQRHPDRDEAWYAAQAADMEEWLLHQEYPSHPEESFAKSGRPVFSPAVIERHYARLRDEQPEEEEWEPGVRLWEPPNPDAEYLIGADVAEGKGHGDYSAAVVVDRSRGVEVAELHGRWPMEDYAAKLDRMGRYFNDAELAVERNNHGHTVLLALESGLAHRMWTGVEEEYPNLYYYADPLRPGNEVLGWETNSKTKPMMLDALAKWLREDLYHTRSSLFLDEAGLYAYLKNGKTGAPEGYYDDLVISRCIVAYMLSQPRQERSGGMIEAPELAMWGVDDEGEEALDQMWRLAGSRYNRSWR
jgi:hypothetical protein